MSAHWLGLAEATPAASIETLATAPNAAEAMRMAGTRRCSRVDRGVLLVIFFSRSVIAVPRVGPLVLSNVRDH
jgi:hypothetical protein